MAAQQAPAAPVKMPAHLWKRGEMERRQRIDAGTIRLQDAILGAWRPDLRPLLERGPVGAR